jgi:hypothetical protein
MPKSWNRVGVNLNFDFMSDNLNIKRPQDPTKVNVNENWELEYWSQKFY